MFKYLIGEKPNFECHGERPVPSTQFSYRAWMLELGLIVYPVCLPGQTSSWRLVAVSLLGSPFLSLYVLIRLTMKDGSEAGADADKDGKCQARMKSVSECSCSECEYGASVVRAEEWLRWSWIPYTPLVGESWRLTEPWLGPASLILRAVFSLE